MCNFPMQESLVHVTPTPVSMASASSPVSVVTGTSVSAIWDGQADIVMMVGDESCI